MADGLEWGGTSIFRSPLRSEGFRIRCTSSSSSLFGSSSRCDITQFRPPRRGLSFVTPLSFVAPLSYVDPSLLGANVGIAGVVWPFVLTACTSRAFLFFDISSAYLQHTHVGAETGFAGTLHVVTIADLCCVVLFCAKPDSAFPPAVSRIVSHLMQYLALLSALLS